MNEEIGKIVEKVGEVWSALTQKSCIDTENKLPPFKVDPKTDPANAAGFNAFNDAFMKGDVDAVMKAMSDDPIFDAPNPQPNGSCFKGEVMVGLVWEMVLHSGITFGVEEAFQVGNRAVVRWNASREVDGKTETLRGCDIFYLDNGKVAAKLTYSKAESFLGLPTP
jgi:hypothetical protein